MRENSRDGSTSVADAEHEPRRSPGKVTRTEALQRSGGGRPLPDAARTRMEASAGNDLSDVRVHTDGASQAAASELGARAFTSGSDIHFGAGEYQPDDPFGMHLLAHEVAHTVQQRGGGATGVQAKRAVGEPGDPHERAADAFADHVVHGAPAPVLGAASGDIIQRKETGARPTLRPGSRGPDVVHLQELVDAKPDGDFGPATSKAVKAFQASAGLVADAVVGPKTWEALDSGGAKPGPTDEETPPGGPAPKPGDPPAAKPAGAGPADAPPGDAPPSERPTLKKGAFGEHVKTMQEQLNAGGANLWPDGNFGSGTEKAVSKFQGEKNLPATGVCGPETWAALDKVAPMVVGPATKKPRSAELQALIDGAYADKGAYKPTTDGFSDGTLDALLKQYGEYWLVDTTLPPLPPDQVKDTQGVGHSAGKDVGELPPWVGVMQQKVITSSKWTDDQQATNQLLRAFLNSWAASHGALASNVEEFFAHIGKSESNNKAKVLGGHKGASNWCAEASTKAAILGLLRKGVRFRGDGYRPKQFMSEVQKQVSGFVKWQTKGKGNVVGPPAAGTAEIDAGDIISIVGGGGGNLSGHAATAVECVGDKLRIVSGNASGESIRVEEYIRSVPPPEFKYFEISAHGNKIMNLEAEKRKADKEGDYDKVASLQQQIDNEKAAHPDLPHDKSQGKPGLHYPKNKGECWVVTITKASKLDANLLKADMTDAGLEAQGLERCDPLEVAYPDYKAYE